MYEYTMFNSYFTARFLLSIGALFNNVCSDRSDGKTFDCKVRALEDYATNRHITIYARRYKSEITPLMRDNFFGDVLGDNMPEKKKYRDLYGDWKFRKTKIGVQVQIPNSNEWDYIIIFVVMTMSGKLKSSTDPYVQRIFTIDYDEFIPLDGRYLPSEMENVLELWKSIDRDRDTVQLLCLGNRITAFNPFFDFFGISLSITNEKIRTYKNNSIAVQIYASKEHRQARSKSKIADAIAGTSYENYDRGGILKALDLKLGTKNGKEYWGSFRSKTGEGSIWYNGSYFCVSLTKRNDGILLVDEMYNVKNRQLYHITFGKFGALFRTLYKQGLLTFESDKAFHYFEPLLQKIYR